jgi:hypothetical protein
MRKRTSNRFRSVGLTAIHTETTEEVSRAKDLFKRAGAEDISYTGESKP